VTDATKTPPKISSGGVTKLTVPAAHSERIGEILVRDGLVTRDQLNLALQEQRNNGSRLGYSLVALGFVKESDLTRTLARQYHMPAVDLTNFEIDPRVARLIPSDMAAKHLVLPLKRDGRTLTVAMADPSNTGVLDDLKFLTRCDIFPVIAGEYTIRNAIERYYESNEAQMENLLKDIAKFGDTDIELVEQIEEDMTAAALSIAVQDAPVVKLINALLTDAVARGASDIHFECFEHELRVRARVAGAAAHRHPGVQAGRGGQNATPPRLSKPPAALPLSGRRRTASMAMPS